MRGGGPRLPAAAAATAGVTAPIDDAVRGDVDQVGPPGRRGARRPRRAEVLDHRPIRRLRRAPGRAAGPVRARAVAAGVVRHASTGSRSVTRSRSTTTAAGTGYQRDPDRPGHAAAAAAGRRDLRRPRRPRGRAVLVHAAEPVRVPGRRGDVPAGAVPGGVHRHRHDGQRRRRQRRQHRASSTSTSRWSGERPAAPEAHVMAARIADLRARIDALYDLGGGVGRPTVITSVGHSVDRAELVYDTLRDTTAPATAAGVLIGLVVVLAAAAYWVQRREREVRLLAAHGASPARAGGQGGAGGAARADGRRGRRAGGGLGAGARVRPEPAALGRGRAVGGRAWPPPGGRRSCWSRRRASGCARARRIVDVGAAPPGAWPAGAGRCRGNCCSAGAAVAAWWLLDDARQRRPAGPRSARWRTCRCGCWSRRCSASSRWSCWPPGWAARLGAGAAVGARATAVAAVRRPGRVPGDAPHRPPGRGLGAARRGDRDPGRADRLRRHGHRLDPADPRSQERDDPRQRHRRLAGPSR